jgi:hypothetical protein
LTSVFNNGQEHVYINCLSVRLCYKNAPRFIEKEEKKGKGEKRLGRKIGSKGADEEGRKIKMKPFMSSPYFYQSSIHPFSFGSG